MRRALLTLALVSSYALPAVADSGKAKDASAARAASARPSSQSVDGSIVLGVGKTPQGRPDIRLDRLDFPNDLRESAALKKFLIHVLSREVRRVEWGAGRENRIEYRYSVTELSLKQEGDVLHVTCTSVGRLPGGRSAKSHLSFGGAPKDRLQLLKKVLEIVARGVVARLADLERARRGLSD